MTGQTGYWWCPECERELHPHEVTFKETHDERYGGCGSEVEWK
jgi:NAD-dependent SIR2 family protein deacetylase